MTDDKFVFRQENFAAVSGLFGLLKAVRESERIDGSGETDSSERRRDQLGAGVREANAEIQSGSYFGRIGRPDDIDRVVIYRVEFFFKIAFISPDLRELSPAT